MVTTITAGDKRHLRRRHCFPSTTSKWRTAGRSADDGGGGDSSLRFNRRFMSRVWLQMGSMFWFRFRLKKVLLGSDSCSVFTGQVSGLISALELFGSDSSSGLATRLVQVRIWFGFALFQLGFCQFRCSFEPIKSRDSGLGSVPVRPTVVNWLNPVN
ncbi:hypothetical protein HanPI659440_Chr10g0382991 [Helianthus annuus]|nr:hypothetical protein HanPI659440_Chr10g0382991 [Helianthus annuus]